MLIYDDIRTYPSTLHHYDLEMHHPLLNFVWISENLRRETCEKTSQNLGVFSLALTPDKKRKVRFS